MHTIRHNINSRTYPVITICIVIALATLASVLAESEKITTPTQTVYVIALRYNSGTLASEGVSIIQGYPSDARNKPPQGYILRLSSFDGKLLHTLRFDVPRHIAISPPPEWFDEKGNQIYYPLQSEATNKLLDSVSLKLIIPYFKDGKSITISGQQNNLLLTVDVGHLAQLCGDSICQPHESAIECHKDCPTGGSDDYCDSQADSICDPDCNGSDPDCTNPLPIFIITPILLVMLIIIITLIKKRSKGVKPEPQPTVNVKPQQSGITTKPSESQQQTNSSSNQQ